jgi:hypothetical protein
MEFYLWGFVKNQFYRPPLPTSLPELKAKFVAAMAQVIPETLHKVSEELDYSSDICWTTAGTHIENL